MKKLMKTVMALGAITTLAACSNNPEGSKGFGDFNYNGIFLREYATKQINVEQAKALVDIETYESKKDNKLRKNLNGELTETVHAVLAKYASLVTTVKYYISDTDKQQVRQDIYQGTDFKYLLDVNHYEPFGQMSVRYLFVDDALLDDMEQANEDFKDSISYIITPFNEPYTYHTNEENKLILQTHSFAELPASTGGGIGSTFKQDCELIFDEEGKITFWQSSLGLYTSTPTGTVKEGYIFEVEFAWNAK